MYFRNVAAYSTRGEFVLIQPESRVSAFRLTLVIFTKVFVIMMI